MSLEVAIAISAYTTIMWFLPSVIYLETRQKRYLVLQVFTISFWGWSVNFVFN